ncbi:hypothetical protein [Noviherbaspirillum saxi]|nr:hypothetical protein [Noviherbaspirillum saxi]
MRLLPEIPDPSRPVAIWGPVWPDIVNGGEGDEAAIVAPPLELVRRRG